MKVFIRSKTEFDATMVRNNITNENVEEKRMFFISINDTRGTDEVPYFEKGKKNVLVIHFDDIEEDIDDAKWGLIKAFTKEQAEEIISFLEKQEDKISCILHCAAGISRSGAVGTFVNDYYRGDNSEFKRNNPHIHPNGLVLRLLNQVMREKSIIE